MHPNLIKAGLFVSFWLNVNLVYAQGVVEIKPNKRQQTLSVEHGQLIGERLLTESIRARGGDPGGGGGKEAAACARKALDLLKDLRDTKAFKFDEVYNRYIGNVKWEVRSVLTETTITDKGEVVERTFAPFKLPNGEIISDPKVAFHGEEGLVQLNSRANLPEYCDMKKFENDIVIMHEIFRGIGVRDEVYNKSAGALESSLRRISRQMRVNRPRTDYDAFGVKTPDYIPQPWIEITDDIVQLDLATIGDGKLIVAVPPGPYRHTPTEFDLQKFVPVGFGDEAWDAEGYPRIGEVAANNAHRLCKAYGFSKVFFLSVAWHMAPEPNIWLSEGQIRFTPGNYVGFVQSDGTIHVNYAGEKLFCDGRGFFGECHNRAWPYRYAFFDNIRCRK